MEFEEVEVTINKEGEVEIKVRGAKGLECLKITKELEEALGSEILARIMTAEAYEQDNPADVDPDQQLKATG